MANLSRQVVIRAVIETAHSLLLSLNARVGGPEKGKKKWMISFVRQRGGGGMTAQRGEMAKGQSLFIACLPVIIDTAPIWQEQLPPDQIEGKSLPSIYMTERKSTL